MDMSKNDEVEKARGSHAAPPPVRRDVPAIIGRNLRTLRKAQDYSLERLAEVSGVSRAMLGQIETGKSVPTVGLLWKIADALGVPVATLMATGNGNKTVVLRREVLTLPAPSPQPYRRRSLLPPDVVRGTDFYELRITPGHMEIVSPSPAGTYENLVVARGELRITVGREAALAIAEGDAVLIEADVARVYENTGKSEAVAYVLVLGGRTP
jgi:transcriptional regulator with XRE-family HTH domain